MKNIIYSCILIILIISCGKDGSDGKAYLALSWVSINSIGGFDQLPYSIENDQYYEHSPGSYSGWYVSWDDSYWTVSYTLEINYGEEASGFIDGDDGMDNYYTLLLHSSGPSMYLNAPQQSQHSIVQSANSFNTGKMLTNFTTEIVKGKYILNAEYKQFELVR
jgi:hypothetical protein